MAQIEHLSILESQPLEILYLVFLFSDDGTIDRPSFGLNTNCLSLSATSKTMRKAYLLNEGRLLRKLIEGNLIPECFQLALETAQVPLVEVGVDELEQFRSQIERLRDHLDRTLNPANNHKLSLFSLDIEQLRKLAVLASLTGSFTASYADAFRERNQLKEPVSPSEMFRIQRAFLRFELFYKAFAAGSLSEWVRWFQHKMFIAKLCPREVEEMVCVYQYLFMLVRKEFEIMAGDLLQRLHDAKTPVPVRHLKGDLPQGYVRCSWRLIGLGLYTEGTQNELDCTYNMTLANGLRYLRKLQTSTRQQKRDMLRNQARAASNDFLPRAIDFDSDRIDHSEYARRPTTQDVIYSFDTYRRIYLGLYIRSPYLLHRWLGYAFLDEARRIGGHGDVLRLAALREAESAWHTSYDEFLYFEVQFKRWMFSEASMLEIVRDFGFPQHSRYKGLTELIKSGRATASDLEYPQWWPRQTSSPFGQHFSRA